MKTKKKIMGDNIINEYFKLIMTARNIKLVQQLLRYIILNNFSYFLYTLFI